ncbi:MAG: hypothetical protein LBU90_10355 [Bacteroidales bacterium]|jgi:hypothetical protein|nr:hypothetical protein [Bacteroidales bacterium]
MRGINKNKIELAHKVKALVDAHYEEGRQDRCKSAVFRNVVRKTYPMSIVTFFRLLALAEGKRKTYTPPEKNQLSLF